jgi:hypothetical protein
MTYYIVIVGNVRDGLSFVGPWVHYDDALAYAEDIIDDWHIVDLEDPFDSSGNVVVS